MTSLTKLWGTHTLRSTEESNLEIYRYIFKCWNVNCKYQNIEAIQYNTIEQLINCKTFKSQFKTTDKNKLKEVFTHKHFLWIIVSFNTTWKSRSDSSLKTRQATIVHAWKILLHSFNSPEIIPSDFYWFGAIKVDGRSLMMMR